MVVAERPLTLEEFLDLPEEKPALEYVDGVVTQKMSPKGRHSRLQVELDRCIHGSAGRSRVAEVFTELRVTFGGKSYVPDLSVFLWRRIPRDSDGRIRDDFVEPPDVTIEIGSPGQSVNWLTRRSLKYVAGGVRIALVIDPDDESVIAYRPGGRIDALQGDDRIDLSEVLPDFELTVAQLFECLRDG